MAKTKVNTMTNKKEYIPALGYDQLTGFYDTMIRWTMPETAFRGKLMDWIAPKTGEKILEFGFGTGQNLLLGYQTMPTAEWFGLDIDPKVAVIAQRKLEQYQPILKLYDGGVFPFEDNSFDKIFSSLVFHQLDTATKKHCLKELYRILKPNGQLVIGDWGKPSSRMQRWRFYAVQLLDGFKTTQANVMDKLPEFIKETGFQMVETVDFINTKIGTYAYYRGKK